MQAQAVQPVTPTAQAVKSTGGTSGKQLVQRAFTIPSPPHSSSPEISPAAQIKTPIATTPPVAAPPQPEMRKKVSEMRFSSTNKKVTKYNLAVPRPVGKVVIIVKDGLMHVYTRIGDTLIYVKTQMTDGYEAAQKKAFETVAVIKSTAGVYTSRAQGQLILVKAKINDYGIRLKFKVIETKDMVVAKVLESNKTARDKATMCTRYVQKQYVDGRVLVMTKVNDSYVLVKSKVDDSLVLIKKAAFQGYELAWVQLYKIPVPQPVKDSAIKVYSTAGEYAVVMRGKVMVVYGKLGENFIVIKAKLAENAKTIHDAALVQVNKVIKAVEPHTKKLKAGFKAIELKVGNVKVCIFEKVEQGKQITLATYQEACAKFALSKTQAMDACTKVKQAILDSIAKGIDISQKKIDNVKVTVKDGYVQITTQVGEQVMYLRATVEKKGSSIKLKIVESYVGTKDAVYQVASTYKQQALTVAKQASDKVAVTVAPYKAIADKKFAEKPVACSAVGGAVVLGAGGGAAGMVSGGVAGAACGLPLALFTFGLSIPVGAVIGGGAGATVGVATGGTAGAVSGSAVGYGYEHRATIKSGVHGAIAKVSSMRGTIRDGLKSKTA